MFVNLMEARETVSIQIEKSVIIKELKKVGGYV